MAERSAGSFSKVSMQDRHVMYKPIKPRGASCPQIRKNLSREDRKQSRNEGIVKHRRMLSSPLQEDTECQMTKVDTNKVKDDEEVFTEEVKKTKKVRDRRREQLQKWQEERMLRKKEQQLTKKDAFVVRHVTHTAHPNRAVVPRLPAVKKAVNALKTINNSTKGRSIRSVSAAHKTRPSAGLANKAGKENIVRNNKTTKPVPVKKKSKAQSQMSNQPAIKRKAPSADAKPTKSQIETRSMRAKADANPVAFENKSSLGEATSQETPLDFSTLVPPDYKFQAPAGVHSFDSYAKAFNFEPLSPYSAQRFILPVTTSDSRSMEEKITTLSSCKDDVELNCPCGPSNAPRSSVSPASHFHNLVDTETERLQQLCASWEKERNDNELLEEVDGLIRAATGQVHLLVTNKFKQFKGLIDLSEDPDAEKRTLSSDLQGFWDMVYFQVEDIDSKFKKLEKLKLNNWEEDKVEVKKKKRRNNTKKTAKQPQENDSKAAESRNKLREMKTRMKAKLREGGSQDAILSPVKNKKPRTDEGEREKAPTPLRRSTRKSVSSNPAIVSTPRAKHEDLQLRLTAGAEEHTIFTEPITGNLKLADVDMEPVKADAHDDLNGKDTLDPTLRQLTKTKKTSVKFTCSPPAEDHPTTPEGCCLDPRYLEPSSANRAYRDKISDNSSLFTPVAPSQSELVTPTPSRLAKTPMPDGSLFTPPPNDQSAEGASSQTTGAYPVTPCTLLAKFHFSDTDRSDEAPLVNDSIFFPAVKPCVNSAAEDIVSGSTDLISFTPMKTPSKADYKGDERCGSVRKFAPVTPSKKLESYLGTEVFSPVRRSARFEANPPKTPTRPSFNSLSEIPDGTDFGYVPNKFLD